MWQALGQGLMDIGTAVWNAREAEKNRDWQEHMSNTSYQRAARDLEKAGLNRVLALGSPASTPSGATSSISNSSAISTGIMASSAKQQIAQSKAEEELIKQREEESDANELLAMESISNVRSQADLNTANANLARIRASKEERLTPAYELIGDLVDYLSDKVRSSAKSGDISGHFESLLNSAKDAGTGAARDISDVMHKIKEWATKKDVRDSVKFNPKSRRK